MEWINVYFFYLMTQVEDPKNTIGFVLLQLHPVAAKDNEWKNIWSVYVRFKLTLYIADVELYYCNMFEAAFTSYYHTSS